MLPQGTSSVQQRQRKPLLSAWSRSGDGDTDDRDDLKYNKRKTPGWDLSNMNMSPTSFGVVCVFGVLILIGIVLISIDGEGKSYTVTRQRKKAGSRAFWMQEEARLAKERAEEEQLWIEEEEKLGLNTRPVSNVAPSEVSEEQRREKIAQDVRVKWQERLKEMRERWEQQDGDALKGASIPSGDLNIPSDASDNNQKESEKKEEDKSKDQGAQQEQVKQDTAKQDEKAKEEDASKEHDLKEASKAEVNDLQGDKKHPGEAAADAKGSEAKASAANEVTEAKASEAKASEVKSPEDKTKEGEADASKASEPTEPSKADLKKQLEDMKQKLEALNAAIGANGESAKN